MSPRGRPLDGERDESILASTMELLEERGYDRLTVKDIAQRAGAGLGAIYRRWPTKSAVVVAALGADSCLEPPPPRSGDPADDLCRALLQDVSKMGRHIPGFSSALRHEPELAEAVRDALVIPRQRVLSEILATVFDDPIECALRAEMALGYLLSRMTLGIPLPDECEIRERIVPFLLSHPGPGLHPAGRARTKPGRLTRT